MNILLLADSLHSIAAGSERQIYKLAEGLVSAGHQVQLLLLRHTAFTQGGFAFPCHVDCLHIKSLASTHAVKTLLKLRKQLLGTKVNVVHAYFPDACLVAPLFLKSKKLRLVTSRRDMGLIYRGKPAWLYRLLAHRTDAVIANSSAVANYVCEKEKLKPTQSFVIHNGIEDFSPGVTMTGESIFKYEDSIKLILVANVKPVKRTLDAVIAVGQLITAGHKVELALAGEKQDIDYVKQIDIYVEEKNLADSIHWLGQVQEPRRILSQAQIGLLISESEGLSNTIMEYMQAGLPVIATRVGGNPELVIDQENGLLISKGDIEGLVNAIIKLIDEPQARLKCGENNRKRIREAFSMHSMIKHHEIIYSE